MHWPACTCVRSAYTSEGIPNLSSVNTLEEQPVMAASILKRGPRGTSLLKNIQDCFGTEVRAVLTHG